MRIFSRKTNTNKESMRIFALQIKSNNDLFKIINVCVVYAKKERNKRQNKLKESWK